MALDSHPAQEDIPSSGPRNSGNVTCISNVPPCDTALVRIDPTSPAPCRKIAMVAAGNLLCFADGNVIGRVAVWNERKSCIIEPPACAAVRTLSCRSSHVMICYDNGIVYILRIDENRSGELAPAHCVLMQWPEAHDVASAEWLSGSSVGVFYTGCRGGGHAWYFPRICAAGTFKQKQVFQAADSGLADHADVRLKVTPELMADAAQELPVYSKSDPCSDNFIAKGASGTVDEPPVLRTLQYLLRAASTEDCNYLCGVMGPWSFGASTATDTQVSTTETFLALWELGIADGAPPTGARLLDTFDSPLSGCVLPTQLCFVPVPGTARSILITACANEVALSPFDPVPQKLSADKSLWLPNGRLVLPVTRRFQMDSAFVSCVTPLAQQRRDDGAVGNNGTTMFFCPTRGDRLAWTMLDLYRDDPAADHQIQSCGIDVGECVSVVHTASHSAAASGIDQVQPRVLVVGRNGTLNACSVAGDKTSAGECEVNRVDVLQFTQAAHSRFHWYLQNYLVHATQKSRDRCDKVPRATLTLATNRCTQVHRALSEASQTIDAECRKLQSNELLWNLAEPNSGLREAQDHVAQLSRLCNDTLLHNFQKNPTITVTNDYALRYENIADFQSKADLCKDMITHETQLLVREVPIRLRHAIGSTMAISGRNEIKNSIEELGRRIDLKTGNVAADFRALVAPLKQKLREVNAQVQGVGTRSSSGDPKSQDCATTSVDDTKI